MIPLIELEKLSVYLEGAHSVCDHENSRMTFHIVKHKLDKIITEIKLNSKPYFACDPDGIHKTCC